jgi:DNA-binding HxlR family transcriptional regulator
VPSSLPPRVYFELTDLGRDLLVLVSALGKWAIRNWEMVESARQAYDGSSRSVVPAQMNAV